MRRIVVVAATLVLACATPSAEKDAFRETSEPPVRTDESAAMSTAASVGVSTPAERTATAASAAPEGSAASSARAVPRPVGAGTPARTASSWAVVVAPSAIPEDPAAPPHVYACPMHPEVRATSAVKCSKCGMPLERVNPK